MKKILLLGLGGTIASEASPEGLTPDAPPEALLRAVPAIQGLCEVSCLSLFNLDSTNMTPAHWVAIARAIRQHYDEFDGFVLTHGTDTMAYTAAALSYLIQGSPKPIILTGAQKPISFETTDSKRNLEDAFVCACCGTLPGVSLVFDGRVILGTRARKTHSKSFQAFSSINYPVLATVQDGRLIQYLTPSCLDEPEFSDTLCEKVGLMKLTPGADIGLLRYLLSHNEAVIIESFGVGGVPSYGGGAFASAIRQAADQGKFIIMTTQVQNEGSDLSVYRVGYPLKGIPNLLEAYDMTTECVLSKAMWILGKTKKSEAVAALFYRPVACDVLVQPRHSV